jgi:quercetin dioxygenase-like cupin family protein
MPDQKHRTYEAVGLLLRFHAFPGEVDGKYCLVEALVPKGLGAPPNSHAGETEGFYVIDGEIDMMIDGSPRRCGAGSFVKIPDGAVHAFAGASERPARILIVNAPGHMHERFFTGIGTPVAEDTSEPPAPSVPDLALVAAIAGEVGMTILPPGTAPLETGPEDKGLRPAL